MDDIKTDQAICARALVLVPDGWKLVPLEPTPEMIDAAGCGWIIRESELRKRIRIYQAMVKAVP